MYNWITTRKIARTDGPNYPTRAAQTVDAVVAKWIPVTAALLACAVTPARPKLDVRTYDWQPEFTWVRPVVDATVRTYIPATQTELQSYATQARPPLDVRRYEWAPESFDIVTRVIAQVRTWIPAFDAELASERVRDRPDLDVRRYEWAPNAFDLVTRVDAQVRTWAPVFETELLESRRTDARPRLDVRGYDWGVDETAWIQSTQYPPATVAQTWPSFQQSALSARTPDGPRLDVRAHDWSPAFSISRLTDSIVATWVPALTDKSSRTSPAAAPDVRRTDSAPQFVSPASLPSTPGGGSGPSGATGTCGWFVRRVYERTTGPQPVYTATLPGVTPPTDAQISPAILQASGLSYRTAARAGLDVRGYKWTVDEAAWIKANLPTGPTVAQTAPAWNQSQHARTRNAAPTIDLFRAQSIPDIFGVPDDWITWVPIQDEGGRTRDRARLDVRAYEWSQPAWIFTSLPVQITDAQKWPAILEGAGLSYRTPARLPIDVRTYEWSPAFSWAQPVVDATIAKLAPIFRAELASFRTADDPRLDVRTYAWAPDAAAWMLINFAPPATPAQYWPALLQNLGTEYQTSARPTLDVRRYDWQPAFTWPARVIDTTVAKWAPVFSTLIQSSPRTGDRDRLNVRTLTDRPVGMAWVSALTLTGELLFPLKTQAINEQLYTLVYLGDLYTTTDL